MNFDINIFKNINFYSTIIFYYFVAFDFEFVD